MEWFLRRGNGVEGPLNEGDVRRMLESGAVSPNTLAAPQGRDFRAIEEWECFAGGAARGTVVRGTDDPFVVHTTRRTAVVGSHLEVIASSADSPGWPGASQQEPERAPKAPELSQEAPGRARQVPAFAHGAGQTFFDSVPEEFPLPKEETPLPVKGRPPYAKVPAPPRLPAQRAPSRTYLLVGGALVVLCSIAAFSADRLLSGPSTSDISRYLPAGASFYLEVPSTRRWSRGFDQVEFWKGSESIEGRKLADVLSAIWEEFGKTGGKGSDAALRKRLLASMDSFAVARVNGDSLYAVHYENDEGMNQYLSALSETPKQTQWGPRYLKSGARECLWVSGDRVEVCGTGAALDSSISVLSGRAPSAEEDAYLNAAKQRSFWSYLPFVEVPALYAVGVQALFGESPTLQGLSGANVTAGIDEKGYIETVDLVWQKGKAPGPLAQARNADGNRKENGELTLYRSLPEGTLFYGNFRAEYPQNSQAFDETITRLLLPAAAASAREWVTQMNDTLGFHPSELLKGFGPESLVAVTLPPEGGLKETDGDRLTGSFWFLQTIEDHTRVRRTLGALVERFSEDRSTLFWKDEHNLIGSTPSGLSIHLRLEKGLLRVGIGHKKELARVLAGPPLLTSDPAHEASVKDFQEEITALVWLDLGRILAQSDLAEGLPQGEEMLRQLSVLTKKLSQSLLLTGRARPVAALAVRQFDTGDVRIQSRNFPSAFLIFGLGGLTGLRLPPLE